MSKDCQLCKKSLGFCSRKLKTLEGCLCYSCFKKTGLPYTIRSLLDIKSYDGTTLSNMTSSFKKQSEENALLVKSFRSTSRVGTLSFDENNQLFSSSTFVNHSSLYHYKQIVSFDLLEDDASVTKGGLGNAVAGHLLLGPVGAVVGAVTGPKKTKRFCNSLKIKITLNSSVKPVLYIHYITKKTKTDSKAYKNAYDTAQSALSALQIAVSSVQDVLTTPEHVTPCPSVTDELLKYKELLDANIITQDEFDAKKSQLLNIN